MLIDLAVCVAASTVWPKTHEAIAAARLQRPAHEFDIVLGAVSLIGGLLASLTAFALAVVAKVKHERWTLLWFPLSVFPALFAFVVLGEVFWWE